MPRRKRDGTCDAGAGSSKLSALCLVEKLRHHRQKLFPEVVAAASFALPPGAEDEIFIDELEAGNHRKTGRPDELGRASEHVNVGPFVELEVMRPIPGVGGRRRVQVEAVEKHLHVGDARVGKRKSARIAWKIILQRIDAGLGGLM